MFVQLSMASGLAENCPVVFSLHGFHNLNLSIKNRIRISSSMLSIWTDEGYFFVNLVSLLHGRAGLRFQFSSFGFCFEAVVLHGRCTSISNTKGSLSKCVCVCLSVCLCCPLFCLPHRWPSLSCSNVSPERGSGDKPSFPKACCVLLWQVLFGRQLSL